MVVNFHLLLAQLPVQAHDHLRSSIANTLDLLPSMVKLIVRRRTYTPSTSTRRLFGSPTEYVFEVKVSASFPDTNEQLSVWPQINIIHMYRSIGMDNFNASIDQLTTLDVVASGNIMSLNKFDVGMSLREILYSNVKGEWSTGDRVFVYSSDGRDINDVVLTYVIGSFGGKWSPANCDPFLQYTSHVLIFIMSPPIHFLCTRVSLLTRMRDVNSAADETISRRPRANRSGTHGVSGAMYRQASAYG